MPQLFARRDPFWDDGRGARRARIRRRIVRFGVLLIGAIVVATVVTRLPAIDPAFLLTGDGKPLTAGALMALLGSAILIALARMRHGHSS